MTWTGILGNKDNLLPIENDFKPYLFYFKVLTLENPIILYKGTIGAI